MPATKKKTISSADSWTDQVHIIGDFNLSIVASTSPVFSGIVLTDAAKAAYAAAQTQE